MSTVFSITRSFAAPRDLVWKSWSAADQMQTWWGPKGCTIEVRNFEFRPGGFFHYAMREDWISKSPLPRKKDWPPKPPEEDREETLPIDPDGGDTNYRKILSAILARLDADDRPDAIAAFAKLQEAERTPNPLMIRARRTNRPGTR